MSYILTLPMSRIRGLAAETKTAPEVAIADLLSVLHSRKMWAHFDAKKSSPETAVFICGANVPTSKRGKRTTASRRGKSAAKGGR